MTDFGKNIIKIWKELEVGIHLQKIGIIWWQRCLLILEHFMKRMVNLGVLVNTT